MLLFSAMLVRYATPGGTILSCPVDLFLLCFISSWTCVELSVIVVFCSLCVFSYLWVRLCCVFDCVGELYVC